MNDPGYGPAFPQQLVREFSKEGIPIKTDTFPGISVRAYIATKVMAGLCANSGGPFQRNEMNGWDIVNCKHEDIASLSVAFADVLIAELSKS